MDNSKWKNIWDNKTLDKLDLEKSEFEIFCDLKKADGFDVSVKNEELYFRNFYREWMEMYNTIMEIVDGELESVYEVGCGSGINLFMFKNRLSALKLGGIDYSKNLISIANKVINNSDDLVCGEALSITSDRKYDLVLSDSVFQYFKSLDYAESVLSTMLSKAAKCVYLGEIHDIVFQKEWLENRKRSMKNYEQHYDGLGKMFYSKEWLENIASKFGRKVVFTSQNNDEYWNSKYVFNCYIY